MKNLPQGFKEVVAEAVGEVAADRLMEAVATAQPVVAVRANPAKGAAPAPDAERVPWEPLGVYIPERPLFAADPAWHQGRYYVQDASSMALGEVIRRLVERYPHLQQPLRYLDACAAPGGKSIAALDALPDGSFLVANEFDRQRANILAENIARHGNPSVAVTRGDTALLARLGEHFDIIGADVPCSGEGMMRKDEAAVAQWSKGLITQCADLQQEIIHNLWKILRPGGFLIYSTCTFNSTENEGNVAMMMDHYGAESINIGLESYPGVIPSAHEGIFGYRFMPGHVRGEGLFISVLRKPGEASEHSSRMPRLPKEDAAARKFVKNYVRNADSGIISGLSLYPEQHIKLCLALEKHPSPIRIGLPFAEPKGKELAPTHTLALSTSLAQIPVAELDYANAMAFLRREAPVMPEGTPRGFVAPAYAGWPLGWCKNIGNRANNLLPDYLRLRLDARSLPDSPPQLPLIYL